MLVQARLSPNWRAVATAAVRLAGEKGLATFRRSHVEVHTGSGFWRRKRQLVIVQSRQLGSDLVVVRIVDRGVAKAGGSRNRPAIGIIKSRIEKRSFATHFQDGNECVPIGHGAPTASPGVKVVTQEAESIRNEGCRGGAIRPEGFAVEQELGIELAWTPTIEHCPDLIVRDTRMHDLQQVSDRR